VLGYALGERFTDARGVLKYADRLAQASPRVRVERYGTTPEGRPLEVLLLARPDRLASLDDLLDRNARLVDPALSAARAASIARENPAIVWLSFGVHGDEASSTEAALWTAFDLATDRSGLLDSLVVVIDPNVNPDGRARYTSWFRQARGETPNPRVASVEHHPPWPGGRLNHYLFDLNRDWAWAIQPETRARLVEWAKWNPQVHVDFHEMSYRSSYFFFPATRPFNPLYPDYTLRWADFFGRANADEFDRRRWLYYTGESFDLFYPGYGDTWPSLVGAIGMTYEQAGGGRAGLRVLRPDERMLTLAERATHHRVAALTTLRAAASRKTPLLLEFAAFHREQTEDGDDVLLVPGERSEASRALVELLQREGIRVERAAAPFRVNAEAYPGFSRRTEFPIGTYRISPVQPRGRMAMTLLRPEVRFDSVGTEFSYDLTAWSLPYAFGVEAHTGRAPDAAFAPMPLLSPATKAVPPPPAFGYLVSPGFEASGPLWRYVDAGGEAVALERDFRMGGRQFSAGTVFLPYDDSAVVRLDRSGLAALAEPVQTARTSGGGDLGTERRVLITAPRIAALAGAGISPTGLGAVWYLLEAMAGIPFDRVGALAFTRLQLTQYDVVVLPAGDMKAALNDEQRAALRGWVEAGGTLVAIGESARWAGPELAGVVVRTDTVSPSGEDLRARGLRTREQRRSDRWQKSVKGVILPTLLDEGNPLAWGVDLGNDDRRLFVLHTTDLVFEPDEEFETVIAFGEDVRQMSGVLSESKRRELASSAWLVTGAVGDGRVILFADDPLFRLFWRSTFTLFTNALLLGPTMR